MIAAAPFLPALVLVGRGRLGRALSLSPAVSGRIAVHVSGREALARPEAVREAVERAGDAPLLLLAVRDDAIPRLAESVASTLGTAPPRSAALHFAGALGLDVLSPLARTGFATGSCHPLQTLAGGEADAARLHGAFFAVEGDADGRRVADELARSLGGQPIEVPRSGRALYHAAASLSANGLTALVGAGRDALAAAGLDETTALAALGPLLRAALEEALARGPEAALTGPAARGDEATIERHRQALLAWDASRAGLFEALLREQRRLAGRGGPAAGC